MVFSERALEMQRVEQKNGLTSNLPLPLSTLVKDHAIDLLGGAKTLEPDRQPKVDQTMYRDFCNSTFV